MPRDRTVSMDEDLLVQGHGNKLDVEGADNIFFDMCSASSWPAASPRPRRRLDPPKAPIRRPAAVDWEVPPLELPTVSMKRRSFVKSISRTTSPGATTNSDGGGPASTAVPIDDLHTSDEAGDEDAMWQYDFDDTPSNRIRHFDEDNPTVRVRNFKYELTGLDALEDGQDLDEYRTRDSSLAVDPPEGGSTLGPMLQPVSKYRFEGRKIPSLGASSVLLSALKQVAAEAHI